MSLNWVNDSSRSFRVLARGAWPLTAVHAEWAEGSRPTVSDGVADCIARAWQRARDEAETCGRILFSVPLVRLVRYRADKHRLDLVTGPTTYKDYVGTNRNRSELLGIVGKHRLSDHLANPLAVCVVVRSLDGMLLVARRSERTFDGPGRYHVVGGHVEVSRHVEGTRVNLGRAILDELREETGIPEGAVSSLTCIGLIEDRSTTKPELTFFAKLTRNHSDIAVPDNEEHVAIQWLDDTPRALTQFFALNHRALASAGAACLILYARLAYGKGWRRAAEPPI